MCPAPLSIVSSSAVTILVGKTGVEYSWKCRTQTGGDGQTHSSRANVSDAEAWVYMMI